MPAEKDSVAESGQSGMLSSASEVRISVSISQNADLESLQALRKPK